MWAKLIKRRKQFETVIPATKHDGLSSRPGIQTMGAESQLLPVASSLHTCRVMHKNTHTDKQRDRHTYERRMKKKRERNLKQEFKFLEFIL